MVAILADNDYRPENIPHLSQVQNASNTPTVGSPNEQRNSISGAPPLHPAGTPGAGPTSGSPVKESTLQRGMSVDEQDNEDLQGIQKVAADAEEKGMPIRQ